LRVILRILKIITIILWIIILFFSVTAVFSATNLKVTVGEVQFLPSSSGITFLLPFTLNNSGYYEIADLNLTSRVFNLDGSLLDQSETIVASIPHGSSINESHKVTIELEDILVFDQESLLLEDNNFNVEIFAALNFARAIPVQISTNTSIPWGAPMAEFSIDSFSFVTYNTTYQQANIPIKFENHAILDIQGTLTIEVYNTSKELIASGFNLFNVPSNSNYSDSISVYARQQDIPKFTGIGNFHIVFETPLFLVEWDEPYG
jgi:hypothetical protein